MVLALLLACAPDSADSAGPSPWTVTDSVRPPVGPIDVVPDGEAVAGAPLSFDIRLPIAADDIAVQLVTGDAVGLGICPAPLSGDCLGVTGTPDLYGPGITTAGITRVELPAVPAVPSFAVQAVIVFPSRSYQSPPLEVPVRIVDAEVCDSGSDEDDDGLTDCADPDCSADPWCTDADGDGLSPAGGDCDDGDPFVSPLLDEICDDAVDNDCDGLVDLTRWYIDADGDGHGTPDVTIDFCGEIVGFVKVGDDCDDADPDISPSADERCNGIDDDCDTDVDEPGVVDGDAAWFDADGDGFGDPDAPTRVCGPTPGVAFDDGDCDDTDAAVYPGAPDVPYDGVDADCAGDDDFDADGDGFASDAHDGDDCDDADPRVHPDSRWYLDLDGDDWGDPDFSLVACDPGGGWALDQPDNCPDVANPDQADGDADGVGDACDACLGGDDRLDADGDGVADACDPCPAIPDLDPTDSDGDGTPDACDEFECDDGLDGDADGLTDCVDPDCADFCDADGDGWRGEHVGGRDCDDADPLVNPDAIEVCDGRDEDCSGVADDGLPFAPWYPDLDGDGFGDPDGEVVTCDGPPPGYVADGTDCDDTRAGVNPDEPEVCDGFDQDCDGEPDDGLAFAPWYPDLDGDGFGDPDGEVVTCDGPPAGHVADATDCDDSRAGVNPDEPEVCDGFDQDCDGEPDDGLVFDAWFLDRDGDGYGDDADDPAVTCDGPPGPSWVTLIGDCDDRDPDRFPGAPEVCDGVDSDCDGARDDDDPDTDPATKTVFYVDGDGDGFGTDEEVLACFRPDGAALVPGDCHDGDPLLTPEDADGDGFSTCTDDCDDSDPLRTPEDADGDGVTSCDGDCDDGDPGRSPHVIEDCSDGVDSDCSGEVDDCAIYAGVGRASWGAIVLYRVDPVRGDWEIVGDTPAGHFGMTGFGFVDGRLFAAQGGNYGTPEGILMELDPHTGAVLAFGPDPGCSGHDPTPACIAQPGMTNGSDGTVLYVDACTVYRIDTDFTDPVGVASLPFRGPDFACRSGDIAIDADGLLWTGTGPIGEPFDLWTIDLETEETTFIASYDLPLKNSALTWHDGELYVVSGDSYFVPHDLYRLDTVSGEAEYIMALPDDIDALGSRVQIPW